MPRFAVGDRVSWVIPGGFVVLQRPDRPVRAGQPNCLEGTLARLVPLGQTAHLSFLPRGGSGLPIQFATPLYGARRHGVTLFQHTPVTGIRLRSDKVIGVMTPCGDLDAPVVASTATGYGVADDQATKEKIILCCGNVAGVGKVNDMMTVSVSEPPAQYYTVVSGDTLSKISKQFYGDANQYMKIFEANKPMLTHPDKIYPSQMLRIPPK